MYSAIVFTVRQVEATGVLPQKIAPVSSRQDQAQPLTARWDLLCSPSKHTVTLAEQCSGSRRAVALTVLRRAGCRIWKSSCQIRAWASADGRGFATYLPHPSPSLLSLDLSRAEPLQTAAQSSSQSGDGPAPICKRSCQIRALPYGRRLYPLLRQL